jgi:hypothetical protein
MFGRRGMAGRERRSPGRLFKRDHDVRSAPFRTIAAAFTVLVLSGCDAGVPPSATADPPPNAPGSISVYLHGRTEVDLGKSWH